jgi:exosome complex RNA-binding protein Rrp42 (RNase PH superfamily)
LDDAVKFLWLAVIFNATAVALLIVVIVVDTDGRAVSSVFGAMAAAILLVTVRDLVDARRGER